MSRFKFLNLADCAEADSILLNDLYFEAKIIDAPRGYFRQLPQAEQKEILERYRSGKFLKVLDGERLVGFLGHGVKPDSKTIVIFYLLLPEARGKGLFKPMINEFGAWCSERYPGKEIFRANTEKSNSASLAALKSAGFEFLEEKLDGPDEMRRVVFQCFIRKFKIS